MSVGGIFSPVTERQWIFNSEFFLIEVTFVAG